MLANGEIKSTLIFIENQELQTRKTVRYIKEWGGGSVRMVFRWFGEGNDSVNLSQIKQIPGVEGVVWALHDLPAGEVWPIERIQEVKQYANQFGLHTEVVESVNIHESIKLGAPDRDYYINNYIETIKHLATVGVKVICYNFMPV